MDGVRPPEGILYFPLLELLPELLLVPELEGLEELLLLELLPEVLLKLIDVATKEVLEMTIDDVVDGQYNVTLRNVNTRDSFPLRASDAVLLSYISNIPLYIEDQLMDRQSVVYQKDAKGMSVPINAISDEMLDKAMQKAITEENYELASQLRDERKRRKNDIDNAEK